MIRLLSFFCILTAFQSFAQYDMEEASETTEDSTKFDWYEFKKNTYIGSDLSLNFGDATFIYLGPFVGYEFYKGLSGGFSTMYQFYRLTFASGNSISSHAFGGGAFLRYRNPNFPYLMLQTEFNLYNAEDFTTPQNKDRATVPAFLLGAGYAGGFEKMYLHISFYYDFIDHVNSPLIKVFQDIPIYYRVGFTYYLAN
ncbi:hypothetical protein K6119_17600 [Paracrocinitomix mangrovi]|uniref:hypothetical protein n=1 Tax=Paracrocinitomix mangrovi TaxID=2862509 RepID=UPI001C8EA551|nr:hypothetical protein [Paracrocinitomix mangrovi]UKN01541.1 hypothetical protein K6119_17600 [Paracrocinitomix mangrovi]